MRKKIMAGNWKMNKSSSELESFFGDLNHQVSGGCKAAGAHLEIFIAAPFTLLWAAEKAASPFGVAIAAQNVHWAEAGAYTGEVSVGMLREAKIPTTLIGHSERRQYFAETNESVAKKVKAALSGGLRVIACVGETLAERNVGETDRVVRDQMLAVLDGAGQLTDGLTIAYEPVWAIGTGLAATSGQAEEVHGKIRQLIADRCSAKVASEMRILYGGSMNPGNTAELLKMPNIDGGLIGGASLKPADFAAMINLAH